jgi:hypothetical protein
MKYYKIAILYLLIFISPQCFADMRLATEAYEYGDFVSAYQEFLRLAHSGNVKAQYNLAFMYYGGEGVEQNDNEAHSWFEKAAKAGHAASQDILGYMYSHGRGVPVDRVRAYAWYSMAAANGIFLSREVSENLKKEMGPAEKIHAELLSREYIEKYGKENCC